MFFSLVKSRRVKTPTLLQMEAVECGAAALGIILGYYGKIVPLTELRAACGVSRDGSKASHLLRAAHSYGLNAKGFKIELEQLQELALPFIVFWNFNHFLVVEGLGKKQVYLNDPAIGPRTVSFQEFDEGYTGVVLVMEPTAEFAVGGSQPSVVRSLWERLQSGTGALVYCVLAGFLLTLPGLAIPVFSQVFVDNILIEQRFDWLRPLLLAMLLTAGIQGLLQLQQLRALRRLKIKLAVGMSSRFLWHILRLPLSFYAQRFAGEISNRLTLNYQVANVLSGRLATTVIDTVMVIFYALVMLQYDWLLTLIVVSFAAVNIYALQWTSRTRVDANQRLVQEYGKVAGITIAALQSIETIKASGLESDFFSRWAGYYTKAINAQQELGVTNQMLAVLPTLLSALSSMLLLVVGGLRVMDGHLSIGMLVGFQGLMLSFQLPVNNLVNFASILQELEGNLTRLDDVLCNPIDPQVEQRSRGAGGQGDKGTRGTRGPHAVRIREGSRVGEVGRVRGFPPLSEPTVGFPDWRSHCVAGVSPVEASGVGLPVGEGESPSILSLSTPQPLTPSFRLQGNVELKHITFGYSRVEPPLIENFSLSLKPGQRVALVGGSGSGKSTIAKLVCGLYEPWEGEILFDGLPRVQIPRQVLTNSIAMVEQDILLFSGTVRENLTLWDATVPEKNLVRACQDAAIHDVIISMSGEYDAQLLEGAANLSGGQRQRLEIARALANKPSILVMDEATSALDAETEKIIARNLRHRGCTCLIVAHRLSTIRDCDEIIVLEQGRVVQRGTHEDLWQQQGVYSLLIRSEG